MSPCVIRLITALILGLVIFHCVHLYKYLLSAAGVTSAQEAVADSRRKVKRAMADHMKVSESLAEAVSSAVKIGELDEVVEQVRGVQIPVHVLVLP